MIELESGSKYINNDHHAKHSSWANWLINHDSNDAGNRNLQAFSNILSLGDSNKVKLQALVKEINTVVLAANSSSAIGCWAYQAKKEEEEQINVVLFVNEN